MDSHTYCLLVGELKAALELNQHSPEALDATERTIEGLGNVLFDILGRRQFFRDLGFKRCFSVVVEFPWLNYSKEFTGDAVDTTAFSNEIITELNKSTNNFKLGVVKEILGRRI